MNTRQPAMDENSKPIHRSWPLFFSWVAWSSILIPAITTAGILIIFSELHLALGENSGYMSGNTRVLNLSSNVLGISFLIFVITWLAGLTSALGLLYHKKKILAGIAATGALINFIFGAVDFLCLVINGMGC